MNLLYVFCQTNNTQRFEEHVTFDKTKRSKKKI